MSQTNESESEKPRRRFELQIIVGGDTAEAMLELAEEFMDAAKAGRSGCVTGGSSAGGFYRVIESPSVTHESYFAAINAQKGAK